MSHISVENVFRDDIVKTEMTEKRMLANAPEQKDGQYQVPGTVD